MYSNCEWKFEIWICTIRNMNELRRIDLNLLLSLHALLTEQHVTRAAQRLHKSQPAVSHALAQLRAHFNDPLLIKQQGKMVLSAKARALLPPLESALGQLNGLLGGVPFEPQAAVRCFRVAMSDYAAQLLLPQLVARLRQQAPTIQLAVVQANREQMLQQLQDGALDLALGVIEDVPPAIHTETLFSEMFVCVAASASLAGKTELTLEQWLARAHVSVALRPDANEEIAKALTAGGWSRHIALSLPYWSAALAVLPGTDLVLTVASRTLQQLHTDELRCFPAPAPLNLPEFAFKQLWHSRQQQDAALTWLRDLIRACCDDASFY